MLLRKYQVNNTLRFYVTLGALQLFCFYKNPDDVGSDWNSERNRTSLLQESAANVFVDLFPEESQFNQDDMNLRKILEESTFQSWQSHVARKSLVEDLIRFDRNDNDRRITLYPLDVQNDTTQEAARSSVSLESFDSRPFSLLQLPNDTRNFDSMTDYGLDEGKPFSFNELPSQDVFLDNSFYDLHLNTISNASTPSSSSSNRKSPKNPLKKDAVLPNINRIRRQDIDFFNRYNTSASNREEEAAMREQETLTMRTHSIYKQDVDLGYTFSNYNSTYSTSSSHFQRHEEAEQVQVIQNLNETKLAELNDPQIDVGYLLSLSSTNVLLNDEPSHGNETASNSSQNLLKIQEDRKLAEILYEQDIDLGYILAATSPKESSSSKISEKPMEKINDKENSNDSSDLWAGIPFKIDNETGEYIRLPFEDIFKDVMPLDQNDLKDESKEPEEPPSPLDLDATIQDIANLLTEPDSEFYRMPNAEVMPFPTKNDTDLSFETQQNDIYDYHNRSNGYNFSNDLESAETHISNNLFSGSSATYANNNSGVDDDEYLDSILNSECFKMMGISTNDSSTTDAIGATGSSGAKKHDGPSKTASSSVGNNVADFLDLSCGSAGSSLGSLSSESLPSTSDGEWGEGSESARDYHHSNFYGPYDYSNSKNGNFTTRQMPVAQKKYHMFGKRYLQEGLPDNANANAHSRIHTLHSQNPISKLVGKENSTLDDFKEKNQNHTNIKNTSKLNKQNVKAERDKFKNSDQRFVQHNHTYAMLHSPDPATERDNSEYDDGPSEGGHLTRDEKRALNLNVPIPVYDIINLPMDEFNERVSKYDLNENQLSLIRDIRRRGKNKVAAQNCRKRKLDTILTLESEVEQVRRRKEKIHNEKEYVANEKKRIANKFAALHKHIFHYLKDDEGKPCSPSKFCLQQSSDGSMYLLPRESAVHDPNYYMSILMGEASTSSACRDRSRKADSYGRTSLDKPKSIPQL